MGDDERLDDGERLGLDELRALQLDRLRATIRRVYERVDHARRAFDDAGVHPDDLRELTDLARFPFTTKADLRANYPFGMFAVPRRDVARLHASSGTTGKPTVVGSTAGDLAVWADLVARSMRAAGARPGDRVHVAYGYGLFTGGLGAHAGAERLGCTVIPVSGGMTERQVMLIQDLEPDVIMVTPTYLLALVEEMEPPHFQCVLTRPGAMDELTVRVERRDQVDEATGADAGRRLAALVKEVIGVSIDVDVLEPYGVERSQGKMRRIVDERPR